MEARPVAKPLEQALTSIEVAEPEIGPRKEALVSTIRAVMDRKCDLPDYYRGPRLELVARIDPTGKAILDVGCAAGAMGQALLAMGAREVVGLDIMADAIKVARHHVTTAYRVDLNTLPELPFPEQYFDIAIFADVLEHLADPERIVRHLQRWIRPGGEVVCSIPNVRNESVLLPLLVSGAWEYTDAGILDRTHLRFFTLSSIQSFIHRLGLILQPNIQAITSAASSHLDSLASLVGALGGDPAQFRREAMVVQYLLNATIPSSVQASSPKPILDLWKGSRPKRLLLVPSLDDPNDGWPKVLLALAEGFDGYTEATVGVALSSEHLGSPPSAIVAAAEKGTLDLLLIETPTEPAGWERLLGGTTVFVATSPETDLRKTAARVGVEIVEAAGR
jgi:SAM-dependent methyltransferase